MIIFFCKDITFAQNTSLESKSRIDLDKTNHFPKLKEVVKKIPDKDRVWVFLMAGQSNMAGRGFVEPQDTIANKNVLTIDIHNRLVYAKEPLHFYEPNLTGLDCGLSFGKEIVKNISDSISVLLLPTAVGGSSVTQWLTDTKHRNVMLLSNFKKMAELGKQYGTIKGILWHQGESDANEKDLPYYEEKLAKLFKIFRHCVGNDTLPVLIGELGSYSNDTRHWNLINHTIHEYSEKDPYTKVINTSDLKDKGDKIHFDSEGQRTLGKRYAEAFLDTFR